MALKDLPDDLKPENPRPEGLPNDLRPENPEVSSGRAFLTRAAENVLPIVGGASAVAALPAEAGLLLTGGALLGAGIGAQYLQNKALESFPETAKAIGLGEAERTAGQEQHPYASMAGDIIPNLLTMRPDVEGIASLFSKNVAPEAKAAIAKQIAGQSALSGTFAGGLDVGQQLLTTGTVDPYSALLSTALGAAGTKETGLGRAAGAPGRALRERITGVKAEPKVAPEVSPVTPAEPTEPTDKVSASPYQDNEAAFAELTKPNAPSGKEPPPPEVAPVTAPTPIEPTPAVEPTATSVEPEPVATVNAPEPFKTASLGTEAPTVGGEAAVIQNRDRTSDQSIAQMQSIAANPDYGQVSVSRSAADGAPIVYGQNLRAPINPEHVGRTDTVTLTDGSKVPVTYAAVEANSVIPSHYADGSPVPDYNNPNASGLKVAAGNGRAAGLQAAHQRGNADAYRASLSADNLHGIDPNAIASLDNPMLVRVTHPDQVLSRPNWGDLTNTPLGLELSPIEMAKNDANRIDLSKLDIGENGVSPDAVRKFINAMPMSEQAGMLNKDGTVTPKAIDRMNAAIFHKAYDNDALTELAYSAVDPEAKTVVNALAKAAPHMMQLDNTAYNEIKSHVADAAEMAINATRNKMSLKDRVKLPQIGDSELASNIFRTFAEHTGSPKRTSDFLTNLAKFAHEEHMSGSEDMFGERPKRSVPELIDLARGTVAKPVELTKAAPGGREDANGRPLHDFEFGTEQEIKEAKNNPDLLTETLNQHIETARKKGIDLTYMDDPEAGTNRIDPRKSMVSVSELAKDKTVADVVKRIRDFVPLDIKEILDRILPEVKDVKIKIDNRRRSARGIYNTIRHDIRIIPNANGNNLSTITHEIVHSATERNYRAAKGYADYGESNPQHIQAAEELDSLFKYIKKIPQGKELKRIGGNIFSHPTELITWAMVDRPVQEILKKIKLPNEETAWSSFVSSVRKLLGLTKSSDDALSKIMDLGERLTGKVHVMPDESRPGVKIKTPKSRQELGEETGAPKEHEVSEAVTEQKPVTPQNINPERLNKFMYHMVNKYVDLKNMHDAIIKNGGKMADEFNAWLQHSISTNRRSDVSKEFREKELRPLAQKMDRLGVTQDQLDEYLHNKHAEERNNQNNKTNEYEDENGEIQLKNPAIKDSGSGIHTDDAKKYLDSLTPEQKAKFESLAKDVRKIIEKTQDMLVASGQETPATIASWRETYGDYVPLQRIDEELNFVHHGGTGGGIGSSGNTSRRAVGSLKTVGDILENVMLQRERAINRAEDIKVGRALYGQLLQHPMPGFATVVNPDVVKNPHLLKAELQKMGLDPDLADRIMAPPKKGTINERTGLAEYRMDPAIRSAANVLPVRINGNDRYIIFNTGNETAMRMVGALKNADAVQIPPFMRPIAKFTNYLSSINTQFNPVFGAWNFMRDSVGGVVNLVSTPLAQSKAKVAADTLPALKTIYSELRARRNGETTTGEWADLYKQFEKSGGKLEFADRLRNSEGKVDILAKELRDLNPSNVRKATKSVMGWLSDYNDSMENAVRLAAFKNALELRNKAFPNGMSPDKAAQLANNITVNFNQKGQLTPYFSSVFSFFNAAVQSTDRLAQTLNSPAGRKIVAGGLALGTAQAMALAAAGFDDEDIPAYEKEKNFILPTGDGTYLKIPMPPGLNIIPNFSRNLTEYALAQAGLQRSNAGAGKKAMDIASSMLSAFNPLGGGPLALELTPTALRPIVSEYANEDAFGRPISRKDQPGRPTPGYLRSRDNASFINKNLAEFMNLASGGTEYQKGALSPTGDDLDYMMGQYFGGVSREAMKAVETAKSATTGEEQPLYRVPIVGKLIGDTESQQAIANRFYQNAERMAGYKAEIEGRAKNPGTGDPAEVVRENPEAAMYKAADNVHNQILKLNKMKQQLQKQAELRGEEPDVDRLKNIEETKTRIMKQFNDAVRSRQE